MKIKFIILCALVLLTTLVPLFAQKTEVTVRKGKVVAETQTASVNIDAGHKAVLTKSSDPVVSEDNPLVDDALKLQQLIEEEKQSGHEKIDSAFIMVGKAGKDGVFGALYFEFPNTGSEPTNVLTVPSASIMEGLQAYDLNGNLCTIEMTLVNESTASYRIYVSEQVQPGERFKLIGVVNLENIPVFPGGAPGYWKEGPLWYFRTAHLMRNCLSYYRWILPESAILVDTNREIVATDTVDGRLAVTVRNYTGEYSDGWCMVTFLWPDEDCTTLADIPDKYHGLQNIRDKEITETFRQEMYKIRAGIKHTDQSSPLAALLTCFGSIIQKDWELNAAVKYTDQPRDTIPGYLERAGYWVNILNVLSTPEWPDSPGNGYVHPIYLCRKGSMICEFIEVTVYADGKWYDHNTKQKQSSEYEEVTPQKIAAARVDGYLCDWEVAGPYVQKDKKGTELFDIPFGPELPGVDVPWKPISLETHDQHPVYINLDNVLYQFDQAVGYLRTEIVSDRRKVVRLEIYTDDGVKAWLNGKQVHALNVSRGILEQPDVVNVTLNEGINELMLKVTDDVWSWGAIVRVQPAVSAQSASYK